MRQKLRELLLPQPKAKIKAGDGMNKGKYKFFTSSAAQSKYYFSALYNQPALIFGTGGAASVHFCKEPFSTSTDCLVMYGTEETNLEMIFYYLRTHMHILQAGFKGAGLQHISKEYILDIEVNLPGIDIQAKIVEQNRLLDRLISSRNTQCDLLDKAVKSRFIELFGDLASPDCRWEIEKFVDICVKPDGIKCGPFGTQLSKDEYHEKGVAVWEITQINSGFTTMPTHYLTEEKAKQLNAYSIRPGDIAMSRKGNVGRCAVFPQSFNSGIIHSDVLRIRIDTQCVFPVFMMHQLHYSKKIQHQIDLVSSGAIMAGINVTKLKNIKVHLPPLALQERFVAFVTQVDKSKLAVQRGLKELEVLKKSLMQKYFG